MPNTNESINIIFFLSRYDIYRKLDEDDFDVEIEVVDGKIVEFELYHYNFAECKKISSAIERFTGFEVDIVDVDKDAGYITISTNLKDGFYTPAKLPSEKLDELKF